MAAYVVVEVEVTNPEDYQEYRRHSTEVVAQYGGHFIARGGKVEALEGDHPLHRVVLIEFPSVEQAKTWYYSPEYQEILPLRQKNGRTSFLAIVEGVESFA